MIVAESKVDYLDNVNFESLLQNKYGKENVKDNGTKYLVKKDGYNITFDKENKTIEIEQNNDENNNYFEYIAEDDSMYPLLDIGDVALIYKQDFITNNATHLIKLNNKNTMRKFILSDDETYYTLVAMNGCIKNIDIKVSDLDQIKIIGKVIKSENKSAFKH